MLKKATSALLSGVMLLEIIAPTAAYAISGGPTQPEFQQFAPAGVNEMVDLFSGDFKYNIPLLDVEGYPININYASGVTIEQEASWVGLGWSLNTGSINRNMRGLPDDFNGDLIMKEMNLKKNVTIGGSLGGSLELFGSEKATDALGLSINASLGAKWNNYVGISAEQSVGTSLRIGKTGENNLNIGLGITSSSDEGLTVQPSVSLSAKASSAELDNSFSRRTSFSIGTAINSRSGMKSVSLSSSTSYTDKTDHGGKLNNVSASGSTSASFDLSQPTYTPTVSMPMVSECYTGRFTAGGEVFGLNGNVFVSGFYSQNRLDRKTSSNPAYGYIYAQYGAQNSNSLMDFNREKDGAFGNSTPALAIPNFTCDVYSVSGQGIGGSYRPFRSSIGHVFDAGNSSRSSSGSLGVEIGAGNAIKAGADITVTSLNSSSGRWTHENRALSSTNFKTSSDPLHESVYFKEAGEKSVDSDPAFTDLSASPGASRLLLHKRAQFSTEVQSALNDGHTLGANTVRQKRDKRNQLFSFLRISEMQQLAIQEKDNRISNQAKDHHVGEITITGTDGRRYIYGIPAYNIKQVESTFSVNGAADCSNGLITYDAADASTSNSKGRDNFYNSTETPAYAHSFLLTCLLSTDYADADNERGPSEGDIGSYTLFKYDKLYSDYKWRTPYDAGKATYNRGLNYDDHDDKASFVYGEKEIWYLRFIETRNYVAEFVPEEREDAVEAAGLHGGQGTRKLSRLKCIKLYSKNNMTVPVKEVHFVYDYSLCEGVSSSLSSAGEKKLTLRKIYFVYNGSYKARFSPYEFFYDQPAANSAVYNPKSIDRWGNFKPQAPGCGFSETSPLTNAEFPYSIQESATANQYASYWNLNRIKLPSGGEINVQYESDDYAYVQNKKANRMFKVVRCVDSDPLNASIAKRNMPGLNSQSNSKTKITVLLDHDFSGYSTTTEAADAFYNIYLKGQSYLYYQFLMQITNENGEVWESVPGYIPLSGASYSVPDLNQPYACIEVNNVRINDGSGDYVCPITRSAIQFGRINLSRRLWGNLDWNDDKGFDEQIIKAFVGSSIVKNFRDAARGPNLSRFNDANSGRRFIAMKSWVRLNEPDGKKLGGGARVKQITMKDKWNLMTGEADSEYGQVYEYTLEDGTSSGVASYEPLIGGEENPFKQPVFIEEKKLMAPDDQFYMEEPFGETFFPGGAVGYSRVTVRDYVPSDHVNDYSVHSTGKVVNEFYTTKDFPTISERSPVAHIRDKDNPASIRSLLKIDVRDMFTASQGFTVELNDMNGKQKAVKIYAAKNVNEIDDGKPITSTEYIYQSQPYLNGSFRLTNQCTVVDPDGNSYQTQIGISSDAVADFRESINQTIGVTAAGNFDGFVIPLIIPIFIPVPMLWPSFNSDRTQFRSAVFVKVIQRFGILEKVVAKDLGSVVETRNLAYDSESGEVLLTETTNDFNDRLYSMKYPAYWHYDAMGPAYKNIGYTTPLPLKVTQGVATFAGADYFIEGDEVAMIDASNTATPGWVVEKGNGYIKVIKRLGQLFDGDYKIRIMRSGRKNQQTEIMATLVTRNNPLPHLKSNIYNNVLQASAIEYSNTWRTFCDCFDNTNAFIQPWPPPPQPAPNYVTTNPYLTGNKGYWRPFRNYAFLTGRTQSNYNNNTNIRNDGEFVSYTPFYANHNNGWIRDDRNWTFASEVTQYSPYGMELENRDALGRFSSSTYSFNQTQITAAAANAELREIGYASFEDYGVTTCNDKHFRFAGGAISSVESHTGYHSIRVEPASNSELSADLVVCEPELECMIEHVAEDVTISGDDYYRITFSGGSTPYNLNYEVLTGTADVYVGCNGSCILIKKATPAVFSITEITLIDSKNCVERINIKCDSGDYFLSEN